MFKKRNKNDLNQFRISILKQSNVKKDILWTILYIFFIFSFGTSMVKLTEIKIAQENLKKVADLAQFVYSDEFEEIEDEFLWKPNEKTIYFKALTRINEDVVGWIEIPGTKINYPILYSKDNKNYLYNDIFGDKNNYGSIFLDKSNSKDFEQKHIIIYGHNIKDGEMFNSLHKYLQKDFLEENNLVKIYTPKGQLDYKIIAAYITNNNYIFDDYNLNDLESYDNYLTKLKSLTKIEDLTIKDSLLTLSTCLSGQDDKRCIVQGILIRP